MNKFIKKRYVAEKQIEKYIPNIRYLDRSGIYLYERTDENGITFFYCGQAKSIKDRCISHQMGYKLHIDRSLKGRGYYREDNPYGWKFSVLEFCSSDALNDKEQEYILANLQAGKQTYNVTYGSQGKGKKDIAERKPPKGYHDGLKQGYKNAQKYVANLFEKHLNYSKKSDKPNKNQEKALAKFEEFLNWEGK